MNQVLQDYALTMLQCADYSLNNASSPSQREIARLEAAVRTLEHLMSTPSSNDLYELKVRTACRAVFLSLLD